MLTFEQFMKGGATRQPTIPPLLMERLAVARLLPADADPKEAPRPGDLCIRLLNQALEAHRLIINDPTGNPRPTDKRLSFMLLNVVFLVAINLIGLDYQPLENTEE